MFKKSVLGLLASVLCSALCGTAHAQTTVANTTYAAGQNVTLSGPGTITAGPTVTVSSGATVTYYASTSITLSPGFTAAAGSTFRAVNTAGVATYTLTVNNGSGSGSGLPAGAVIGITGSGSGTFTGWTLVSGSGAFGNTAATSTTFTLGSANAVIQANYSGSANDLDGDGIPNAWETQYGLNPNSAADAALDPDSDGLTNVAEYNGGTNPGVYNAGTATLGGAVPAGWPNTGDAPRTAATAVGATAGTLQVDQNGAATYTVALWTTPGTAGLEPKLTLNYSSQAGNGIAGFGWSLSGASAITRGPQTLAIDGQNRGVTLTANDRFYLDGQRLIAVSGAYGANGTEYRTERDSISKIVSYGTRGSGPAYFRVWTKAGLIIDFGHPDGVTNDGSTFDAWGKSEVLSWHASRIADTKSNYMAFAYTEDAANGVHLLDRIDYTGNTAAGTTPYASVRFTYADRPDGVSGYLAGSPVSNLKRLTTIQSYYGETVARTYTLNYGSPHADTGRVMLDSITETGADGKSYPALSFQYAPGDTGWTEAGATYAPPYLLADNQGNNDQGYPAGSGFMDLNGDGRTDFIAKRDQSGSVPVFDEAYLNNGNGWVAAGNYRLPYPLALNGSSNDTGSRFADLNGDGLVDYLYRKHGGDGSLQQNEAFLNDGNGWVSHPEWRLPVALARDGDPLRTGRFLDVNGDGRVDFVAFMNAFAASNGGLAVYLNTGAGWQQDFGYSAIGVDLAQYRPRFLDVNGDGLVDIVANFHGGGSTYRRQTWINTGAGWSTGTPLSNAYLLPQITDSVEQISVGAEFADVNGDGLPDLIWYREMNTGYKRGVALNTGAGWKNLAVNTAPLIPGEPTDPIPPADQALFDRYAPPSPLSRDGENSAGSALIDVNADGQADFVNRRTFTNGVSNNTVHYRQPGGWAYQGGSAPHNLPVELLTQGVKNAGVDFADLNADGVVDLVQRRRNSTGIEVTGAWLNRAQASADRLIKVTNGLGVAAQLAYAPLTARDGAGNPTVYDKGATTPDADTVNAIGPMWVVQTVTHDDGLGGNYALNYRYGALRSHRLRGSLGFETQQVTDTRTGIVSTTTYSQTYPFIGLPVSATTRTAGGTTLSSASMTYADKTPAGPTRLPYATQTVESSSELTGALIATTTTTITDFDATGNVRGMTVTTSDGFTKTTTNEYTAENPAAWLLGRLTRATVASTGPAGYAPVTRTSAFSYDPASGLLLTETVEPNDATQTLTTTYTYDAFGNKTTVTVTGNGLTIDDTTGNVSAAGSVSRATTTQYDTQGRFPLWTRNALGHQESYTGYDPVRGVLTQLTGANGLITSWQYDGFGRKTTETRADGTQTITTYKWAGGDSPAGSAYLVETQSSGAAPALAFYDNFGRARWSAAINGDGRLVWQETRYDAQGRAYARSNPYFSGSPTIHWTQTTSYDLLNRPMTTVTPDDENGPQTTTTSYNGLTSTATDPKGRVAATTRNTQGWTLANTRNQNALGGATPATVTYGYDAAGNLTSTNAAGVITTLAYDLRGRKTSMVDPDMGAWQYRYNAFGELVWQKDALGQIVRLTYDTLGRLVSRAEPEGTTTWTYDTAANGASTWKGKLASVSAPGGYLETYDYDSLGRPVTTWRTIPGVVNNPAPFESRFFTTVTYDAYSRPLTTIYPTQFRTRNVYNAFGYLKEVRQYLASDDARPIGQLQGPLYWQADNYDAAGRINGEVYGNGLVNDRVYSEATGRLRTAIVGRGIETASPYSVQYLTYAHDAVGNIVTRNDAVTSRNESFGYDGLDRLVSHTLTGAVSASVTVGYDATGNITSKSDVGTYTYSGYGPHAVSTAGANSYTYDAVGNMLTGAGRTLQWSSFNQLKRADLTGGKFAQFDFGAGRERVKQTSHLGTTSYVGALFERFTPAGAGTVTEDKHYIFAPTGRVAVYTRRSNLVNDTRWFHTDGLGSITAVTNEAGSVVKRFAFDAWGKRLDPSTNGVISSSTSGGFTRGFTDHEQLDDLGLVHMNGRVYDPTLGRFLSADPNVDGADDAQGFNRYSYVGNNPLTFSDPSGYFRLGDALKIVAIVAIAVVAAVYAGPLVGSLLNSAFGVTSAAGTALTAAIGGGIAGGFASGFAGSLLNGSSVGDAFKAGVIGGVVGGITAGLFHGIGSAVEGIENGLARELTRTVAHGAVGGAIEEATGGEFRHGFYAAAFTAAVGPNPLGIETTGDLGRIERTAVAAVAGGTAAAIGGGKFANGAVTGAFQHLFNYEAHAANRRAIPNGNDSLLGRLTRFVATFGGQELDDGVALAEYALGAVPRRIDAAVADAGGGPGEALAFKMALGGALGQLNVVVAESTAVKGLSNPFKVRSATEIEQMLLKKGYQPRGPNPVKGKGGYVNTKNGRSYHIDEANSFGETPHVDVNRPKGFDGLDKKKLSFGRDGG